MSEEEELPKEKVKKDYTTIWNPKDIPVSQYRKEYPELYQYEEFQQLNDTELVMVWYFANPTSPYMDKYRDMEKRLAESHYKSSGGFSKERSNAYASEYRSGSLPNYEKIKAAIEVMSRVNPHVRTQAARIIDTIVQDYMDVLSKPITDFKRGTDGETDYSSYIRVRSSITANIDQLIQKAESGFGTKKISEKKVSKGDSHIEKYLTRKSNAGTRTN